MSDIGESIAQQRWRNMRIRLDAERAAGGPTGEPALGIHVGRLTEALIQAFDKNGWSTFEDMRYVSRERVAEAIAERYHALSHDPSGSRVRDKPFRSIVVAAQDPDTGEIEVGR